VSENKQIASMGNGKNDELIFDALFGVTIKDFKPGAMT
jgi:hypothetical protein